MIESVQDLNVPFRGFRGKDFDNEQFDFSVLTFTEKCGLKKRFFEGAITHNPHKVSESVLPG